MQIKIQQPNQHMSRRVVKAAANYFKNPLVQGKYPVIPPPPVPPHIVKPAYVGNPNPKFGQYQSNPVIPSQQQIQKLKVSAQIASKALEDTQNFILEKAAKRAPLTEEDIDRFVFDNIVAQGAYPTPIGFMKFPKSVCVSVNECIVHGIPSTRPLDFGDKINIDITAYFDGYHGDNNLTVFYGEPQQSIKLKVAEVTQKALYEAIALCKPGVRINQIGKVIQRVAGQNGLHVCEHFTGHGVGHLLHMPPMVFHRYYHQYEEVMRVGQVFTIEPIISLFPTEKVSIWQDNFTTISPNNPNAQFQHTILIVEDGCEILTKRPSENIPNPNKNIKNV